MNSINEYKECRLCPRECKVDRTARVGFCSSSDKIKIARAVLHFWEEPCISGKSGSGAVFFSGCTLRCVFCQNHEISHLGKGYYITTHELADTFIKLQDEGANNINLVSPTPYVPSVIEALDMVKHKLYVPIVYNCGGYESLRTLDMLNGYIDVYLPDLKYYSDEYAKKYSNCSGYFETAIAAIKKMVSQVGKPQFDADGLIKKGVIVRHLVLPTLRHDSIDVINGLKSAFSDDEILLSLMSQYTPVFKACEHPEINRRISTFEYNCVLKCVQDSGFDGYSQERSASDTSYIPKFYDEKSESAD